MLKHFLPIIFSLALLACSGGDGSIHGQSLATTGRPAPALVDDPDSLQILIFGGTSGIGLETTRLALARGHCVTSVTRRPERMPIEHINLINLKGDITDRDSFNTLLKGKHAVISAIGLKPSRDKVTVYSQGIKNLLAAMRDSGVDRVLTITGIGAGESKGHGGFFYDRILNPLLLKTHYQDKSRQEVILKASASRWTIVRPGFLNDAASQQRYRVIRNLQGVVSGDIARADVAHFLLAAVEQNRYINDTVLLSN